MQHLHFARHLVAVVLAALLAGPGHAEVKYPEYRPEGKFTGEFHTMGSPVMDTITLGWIEIFRAAHPEIEDVTTMEARSNNSVVEGLISGLSHVGPASRAMFPSERAAFVKKFGYEPTQFLVCSGAFDRPGYSPALAIYVHEDNPLEEISLAQLEEIWSRNGRITKWGQLGLTGEWAEQPVTLFGLNLPNGIATYFQEAAMNSREFRGGISTRSTDRSGPVTVRALSRMVMSVGENRYGMTYAGGRNAQPRTKMLRIAQKPGGPAVALTRATVLDHSYPLSRYLYVYVNRAPGAPLDPKVKEFLRVALSRQGQELIEKRSPLLPLPPAVALEELAKIR